jgi:hypothetical protein
MAKRRRLTDTLPLIGRNAASNSASIASTGGPGDFRE